MNISIADIGTDDDKLNPDWLRSHGYAALVLTEFPAPEDIIAWADRLGVARVDLAFWSFGRVQETHPDTPVAEAGSLLYQNSHFNGIVQYPGTSFGLWMQDLGRYYIAFGTHSVFDSLRDTALFDTNYPFSEYIAQSFNDAAERAALQAVADTYREFFPNPPADTGG